MNIQKIAPVRLPAALLAPGLMLLLLGGLSQAEPPAAPARPSATASETKPVLLSDVPVGRLAGEVVCIYNFSSW